MKKYITLGVTAFSVFFFSPSYSYTIETAGIPSINIVPSNLSSANFQKYSIKRKALQTQYEKLLSQINTLQDQLVEFDADSEEFASCEQKLNDCNTKLTALGNQISAFNKDIEEVVYKDPNMDRLSVLNYLSLKEDEAAWDSFQKDVVKQQEKLKKDKAVIQNELSKIASTPKSVTTNTPEGVILSTYAVAPVNSDEEDEENTLTINNQVNNSVSLTQSSDNNSSVIASFAVLGESVSADETVSSKFSTFSSPEALAEIEKLKGKKFDRLVAHSDGATIAECLIRKSIIKVKELDIMEGDMALLNGADLQNLIDNKMVERVVVWSNLNDPSIWLASTQAQDREEQTEKFITIDRKYTSQPAKATVSKKVEYKWIVSNQTLLAMSAKDPQFVEAYFKEIAKEFKAKK